jgi:hypothetical protein
MQIDAKYPLVSQFEWGESAYECGFFTVALQKAAGEHSPGLTAEQVDQLADKLYRAIDGPNTRSNTNGMTETAWYACLKEEGIAYENVARTPLDITDELNKQRAVCVTVSEASVHDLDLRDAVPYRWQPSGNHIITLVGYMPGEWLAIDQANIGPSGIRSWPRRYDLAKLEVHLATAILFPWLSKSPVSPPETYLIQAGDNLWEIAQRFHTTSIDLYHKNQAVLDKAAQVYGHKDCNGGALIFAGTVIEV